MIESESIKIRRLKSVNPKIRDFLIAPSSHSTYIFSTPSQRDNKRDLKFFPQKYFEDLRSRWYYIDILIRWHLKYTRVVKNASFLNAIKLKRRYVVILTNFHIYSLDRVERLCERVFTIHLLLNAVYVYLD